MDRARKIAKRLHDRWGGATEEEYEFPPKPPRMRWATYNRLEEQYDELENRWALGIMTRFARLKERHEVVPARRPSLTHGNSPNQPALAHALPPSSVEGTVEQGQSDVRFAPTSGRSHAVGGTVS